MRSTVSAVADGAVCVGGIAVSEGVLLIKNCTSAVPHYIALFQEAFVAGLLTDGLRSFQ